ncbi:hypothetical protein [Brevundimonas sp.]|uniref:hypothetical protein n=1 Tax=Brevundimonas sp. TaxID=1871086 RepID=UPI0026073D26|nr:hypothetical protein [Brevundimonas sp.]
MEPTDGAQPPRDQRSELDHPAPDRLVANLYNAGRHQFLDAAKTEAEAGLEPDGMADDVGRKPVAHDRNRLAET